MNIPFVKAHGAKNDFLLTLKTDAPADESRLPQIAVAMCDRYTGVGADGWMLVDPARRLQMPVFVKRVNIPLGRPAYTPVSYTHLDVYKRQHVARKRVQFLMQFLLR